MEALSAPTTYSTSPATSRRPNDPQPARQVPQRPSRAPGVRAPHSQAVPPRPARPSPVPRAYHHR
eukprot:5321046-Pyramimonas_sp.AAC.1